MKIFLSTILLFHLFTFFSFGQKTLNPKFENKIESYISHTIPVITVSDAFQDFDRYIFLDARNKKEYEISKIKNAIYVGYDDFNIENIKLEKNREIIIYCSIGYRSEIIGEKLQRKGFTQVHNLYGSIFEWVNQGYPIVRANGSTTDTLHTYNRRWAKWVEAPNIVKTW